MKKLIMITLASQAFAGDLTLGTGAMSYEITNENAFYDEHRFDDDYYFKNAYTENVNTSVINDQVITVGYSDEFDINMPAKIHVSAEAGFAIYSPKELFIQGSIGPSIPVSSDSTITVGPSVLYVENLYLEKLNKTLIGTNIQLKREIDESSGFIASYSQHSKHTKLNSDDSNIFTIKAYKTL